MNSIRKDMWNQYWYDRALNMNEKSFGKWIKKREIRIYGEKSLHKSYVRKIMNKTNDFMHYLNLDMMMVESKEESPIIRLFRDIPATNYKRREKVIPIDNEAVLRDFTYYTGGMFILTNIKIEDRKK